MSTATGCLARFSMPRIRQMDGGNFTDQELALLESVLDKVTVDCTFG